MATARETAVRRWGKKQRRMIHWTTKVTGEPMRVSHMQASNAVDMLMKYFVQTDFATADNMHQTAVTTCVFAPRSKKMISDFFRPSIIN